MSSLILWESAGTLKVARIHTKIFFRLFFMTAKFIGAQYPQTECVPSLFILINKLKDRRYSMLKNP